MRILSLALAAALVVGVSAAPRPASAAPDGSYRSSCRDLQIDGSILSATCQTAYGGWQRTSIDYKRCQGDISNDRGRLICRREWGDTRDWRDGDPLRAGAGQRGICGCGQFGHHVH